MRIINADPLWEQFREQQCEFTKYSRYHQLNDEDKAAYDRLETVLEQIDSAPTLTLDDIVPHGRWEECDLVEYDGHGECIHYPHEGCVCTNCRNAFKKEFVNSPRVNYCPNCSAKMDLEG